MGQPRRGLSRRGLGRAFARLWLNVLVACGLYLGFAGRDPTLSRFTAGVDPDDARFLEETAYSAVYWN